jgi:MOSC domain-containing protein YiiM
MNARVASLHLHPSEAGEPLRSVTTFEVVEQKGIAGNPRYFARKGRDGQPTKRQVTLIEREQIAEHAAALGLETIPPGVVRSNIETEGIELVPLAGRQIEIGTAVLEIAGPRDPCSKMDAICQGLRERMMQDRQGVLARVIRSGTIRAGDAIRVLPSQETAE